MFGYKDEEPEFGVINAEDDDNIEVQKMSQESRRNIFSESILLIRDLILVLAIFILFGVFVAQPVVVEGTSMDPNLHDGERLLVDKLIYYKIQSFSFGHLVRGDIVVFWYPRKPDQSYVKRVIALPGERVALRNGKVFINGIEMNEPYLSETNNQGMANYEEKTVEDHHYFVMGDNRDNSSDSRIWGQVPEKYIYGKAFFRYWSPSQVGFLGNGEPKLVDSNPSDSRLPQNPILSNPIGPNPPPNE
jgi:signal peptidase I